jgi:hypothetical protein
MKHFFSVGLKLLSCYLLSAAAYLLFIKWPYMEGHSHIPFSGFPEFLIWAPIAPYFMISDIIKAPSNSIPGVLVFTITFALIFWVLFKWRKLKPQG